jgi:hypothetical protein
MRDQLRVCRNKKMAKAVAVIVKRRDEESVLFGIL